MNTKPFSLLSHELQMSIIISNKIFEVLNLLRHHVMYANFNSTVVKHSTHNPKSKGSHPVTHSGREKWRYKCYISNTYLQHSIGTLISRVFLRPK